MLQEIINFLFYSILNLDVDSKLVSSMNFFVYDSIKIILLLFVMISLIGFGRSYLQIEKLKKYLSKKHSYVLASIFGAITPFCSCSSIPIFLSFLKAGVPLGSTFSFLITSPIVNQYLVVMMFGFFGWKITLAYVILGIFIGVVSGIILNKLGLEKLIEKDMKDNFKEKNQTFQNIKSRIKFGVDEATEIIKKLWLWILLGVGLGAIIHNYVPQSFIEQIKGPFAVPLAVLLGVPIYGSCAAILPVGLALFQKGISLGTSLAFMMAISALSLPQVIILRRAMKLKLIGWFYLIVTLSIIAVGYILNFLQPFL